MAGCRDFRRSITPSQFRFFYWRGHGRGSGAPLPGPMAPDCAPPPPSSRLPPHRRLCGAVPPHSCGGSGMRRGAYRGQRSQGFGIGCRPFTGPPRRSRRGNHFRGPVGGLAGKPAGTRGAQSRPAHPGLRDRLPPIHRAATAGPPWQPFPGPCWRAGGAAVATIFGGPIAAGWGKRIFYEKLKDWRWNQRLIIGRHGGVPDTRGKIKETSVEVKPFVGDERTIL